MSYRNFKTTQLANNEVLYENIYSQDVQKQKEITSIYIELFKIKTEIEEDAICQAAPSTTDMVLMVRDNLPHGIVHSSFGK